MNKLQLLPLLLLLVFVSAGFSAEKKITSGELMMKICSPDGDVKRKALEVVKNAPPEGFARDLSRRIIGSGRFVFRCYTDALFLLPRKKFLPQLLDVLQKTKILSLQQNLIRHLSKVSDRRVVLPLASFLNSPHSLLRKEAALSLSGNRDDRMYPVVIAMAGSDNPAYRIYAAEALKYLYDKRFFHILIDLMKDDNKSVRIYTLQAIQSNRIREALYLVTRAARSDINSEVRAKAIWALGEMNETRIAYILNQALTHDSYGVKLAAVKAAEKLGIERSITAASAALANAETTELKYFLLNIIINSRRAFQLKGLAKIVSSDPDISLRIKAAYALGVIKDSRSIPVLVQALKDPDSRVRAEAASSLGFYSSRESVDNLIMIIEKDMNRYVRSSALYSLKKIRSRDSIIRLFDLFYDEKDPLFKVMLHETVGYLIKLYN